MCRTCSWARAWAPRLRHHRPGHDQPHHRVAPRGTAPVPGRGRRRVQVQGAPARDREPALTTENLRAWKTSCASSTTTSTGWKSRPRWRPSTTRCSPRSRSSSSSCGSSSAPRPRPSRTACAWRACRPSTSSKSAWPHPQQRKRTRNPAPGPLRRQRSGQPGPGQALRIHGRSRQAGGRDPLRARRPPARAAAAAAAVRAGAAVEQPPRGSRSRDREPRRRRHGRRGTGRDAGRPGRGQEQSMRLPDLEDALRNAQKADTDQRASVVQVQQQIQVLAAEQRSLDEQRRQFETRFERLRADRNALETPDEARLNNLQSQLQERANWLKWPMPCSTSCRTRAPARRGPPHAPAGRQCRGRAPRGPVGAAGSAQGPAGKGQDRRQAPALAGQARPGRHAGPVEPHCH